MKTQRALFATIVALFSFGAFAQQDCPTGEDLPKIPELVSKDGKLRATIIVKDEQVSIGTRNPNSLPNPSTPGQKNQCFPQIVRAITGVNAVPPYPKPDPNKAAEPLPGPTLRAQVGDLVELTFINNIDMNRFPKSLDKGQCDQVTGIYPTSSKRPGTDIYPNCFHGSTTANIHFHGTHVNPNTTGDNVFVEIRPSLRTRDQANKPTIDEHTVKHGFDQFFTQCEKHLLPSLPVKEWPRTWSDFPKTYTDLQEAQLKKYDKEILGEDNKDLWLWPVDAKQKAEHKWPQYYIGAFPYCFRIPQYLEGSFPPSGNPHAIHAAGAGSAEHNKEDERPLVMGQAPGTHWYHAHKHGSTTIDVSNGMTGAFIIEGKYDIDLNNFYGAGWTRKQPVMVINQLGVSPNLERPPNGRQDKGPDFSVNGRLQPVVHMRPGEVQMWRIINTSGRAGIYFPAPPAGFEWMQLAQDGVQLHDDNYQASKNKPFLLMAGNRGDFLVKAPTALPNGKVPLMVFYAVDPQDLVQSANNTPASSNLLTIAVGGEPAGGNAAKFIGAAPEFPPFLADITNSEIKGTKRLVFATAGIGLGPKQTIDGKQFGGEVGAVVLLNNAEEWTVVNETYGNPISHPFHIHVNPFQVTEVFDPNQQVPDPSDPTKTLNKYVFSDADKKSDQQCVLDLNNPSSWKPCNQKGGKNLIWWDVFPIPSGRQVPAMGKTVNVPGYFKMRSRFVDYPGFYVLHCHILAHEDRGMMTIVEVAPLQSPYSHH